MSPETVFVLKALILAVGTAITAVIHMRWICNKAGEEAAAAFDARQRELDTLYGDNRSSRSFTRYQR
jgi:hypothetical protein